MNGLLHHDLAATCAGNLGRDAQRVARTRGAAIGNGQVHNHGEHAEGWEAFSGTTLIEVIPSAFLQEFEISRVIDVAKTVFVEAPYLDLCYEFHVKLPF